MPDTPQPSRRQQMKNALDQVIQKVADDKVAARKAALADIARQRRRARLMPMLTALAGLGLLLSLTFMLPLWRQPVAPPTGAAASRSARQTIWIAQRLVSRFEETRGRLPVSLEETGVSLPAVTYTVVTGGYELRMDVEGRSLIYHSGMDPIAFRDDH